MKLLISLLVTITAAPTLAESLPPNGCGISLQTESLIASRKRAILAKLEPLYKSLEEEVLKSRFYEAISPQTIRELAGLQTSSESAAIRSVKQAIFKVLRHTLALEVSTNNKQLLVAELLRGTSPTVAILINSNTTFLDKIKLDKEKAFEIIAEIMNKKSDLFILEDNEKLFDDIKTIEELEAAIQYEIAEGVKKIFRAFHPLTMEQMRDGFKLYTQDETAGINVLRHKILSSDFPYLGRGLAKGAGFKRILEGRDIPSLTDLEVAEILVNVVLQPHAYKLLVERLKERDKFLIFMKHLGRTAQHAQSADRKTPWTAP